MSLGPDEWTMLSPWDWTPGCTGMPYVFSVYTRPSAREPELECLVWMGRRKGIGRDNWMLLALVGRARGLREAPCGSQRPGIPQSSICRENGDQRREMTWLWSHSRLWWRSGWDPVLLTCSPNSLFFIKWWHQFSSFLGLKMWTFPSWPTLSSGLWESKRMIAGYTRTPSCFISIS